MIRITRKIPSKTSLIVLVLALSLVFTLTIGDVILSYQETKPGKISPEKIRLSADVFSDLSRNMTTSTNGTG